MSPSEKVRQATESELDAMPRCLYDGYQAGRPVVKALVPYTFKLDDPLNGVSEHRLEPGQCWSFWPSFMQAPELVVLVKRPEWYRTMLAKKGYGV